MQIAKHTICVFVLEVGSIEIGQIMREGVLSFVTNSRDKGQHQSNGGTLLMKVNLLESGHSLESSLRFYKF
jgi:hypothetical protein